MKKRLFLVGLTCLAISCKASISAEEGRTEGREDNTPQEIVGSYDYWPAYDFTNSLESVYAQRWKGVDHTIEGWDFSLPKKVKVSPNSLLTVARIGSVRGMAPDLYYSGFQINPACELWINWRDVEPQEGKYDWKTLKLKINEISAQGYQVILRLLTSARLRNGQRSLGYAPEWLDAYGIPDMATTSAGDGVICFDPSHPEFHSRYLKLIRSLGESGIPDMVRAAYVGYGYSTHGEEGIAPAGTIADNVPHVRERLDAWEEAFKGQTYKVYMGGPTQYGFDKGFGVRRGFVEMYWYTIPNTPIGQYVTPDGYLSVDEQTHVIKNNTFNGEENEEYEEAWATAERNFRFGTSTDSFVYRYFVSMLRAIQMRCTSILLNGHLIPEMLPFISQELGRTVEDTPDIWSFMIETTLRAGVFSGTDFDGHPITHTREITAEDRKNGIAVRNFERWLYQRDKPGYETTPAVKIKQPVEMWMIQPDKYYDYIARRGAKIGFYADDRFDDHTGDKAIKITYLDISRGEMSLNYLTATGEKRSSRIELDGDNRLKTTTIILNDISLSSSGDDFDFTLEAEGEAKDICVSMVRIVKL